MSGNDDTGEEFSFRFWNWELKAKRPGRNTIKIVVIISLLIVAVTAMIIYS
jgi:hypothetical protein